jgi:hypothetical protein
MLNVLNREQKEKKAARREETGLGGCLRFVRVGNLGLTPGGGGITVAVLFFFQVAARRIRREGDKWR